MGKFMTLREEFESETGAHPFADQKYIEWLEKLVERDKELVAFSEDQENLFERYGTFLFDKHGSYRYMSFAFKETDRIHVYEAIPYHELPERIREFFKKA